MTKMNGNQYKVRNLKQNETDEQQRSRMDGMSRQIERKSEKKLNVR